MRHVDARTCTPPVQPTSLPGRILYPMADDENRPAGGGRPIRRPAEPRRVRRDTAAPRRSGPGRAWREQPNPAQGSTAPSGPAIPASVEAKQLAPEIRAELFTLDKTTADTVARHLVAAGELLDEDPQTALAHAQAARTRSGRIAATAGIGHRHCRSSGRLAGWARSRNSCR